MPHSSDLYNNKHTTIMSVIYILVQDYNFFVMCFCTMDTMWSLNMLSTAAAP